MTVNKTLYEVLKFLKDFILGIVSLVSALLLVLGVTDQTVTIVTLCLTTAGQIIVIAINSWSKNHWKAVNTETGEETEIEPIETEEAE